MSVMYVKDVLQVPRRQVSMEEYTKLPLSSPEFGSSNGGQAEYHPVNFDSFGDGNERKMGSGP